MLLNGSEIVIECLKEQGVDTVFGYPGGAILNIYDELYKHSSEIRHVLTSHEQGASHAADGYARATGKVGVCFATSGPGATNLVTGIATAYMDSVPIVAITANVGRSLLGRDSFQEVDIAGITMPITKYNFIVKDVHDLANVIRRAFSIAKSGRPGPVLVDITKNATADKCEYEYAAPEPVVRSYDEGDGSDLKKAAEMIAKAERPVIFTGGGCIISGASDEVRALADKIQAPVCDSLMGKGTFPGTDPLYTGMLGMHGTKASNYAVVHCDLLITLGARFSDRDTGDTSKFAENARILQIDIDRAEVNKNVNVDHYIIGDVKCVLQKLIPMVEAKRHDDWVEKVEGFKEKHPLKYDDDRLTGPYVIEELYRVTKGEALIVTEVGQNQMWAAQYYKYTEPRHFITSGGLGTMGYGLGASMGVKLARPDETVINVAGDGCFRMNMNELATAVRYDIPFVELILNNHVLGMVRQWQTLFYGKRYSATVVEDATDFVKVAEAVGATGIRVTKKEEVAPALEKAIALNKPVLIDCIIDEDDKVFPMVPAGAALEETFDADDLKEG